jgi:hypothetical protein
MKRSLLLAVWLGSLLITGCDMLDRTAPNEGSVMRFDGAPVEVRERGALPPCGEERSQGDAGANIPGRRCLWAAYLEHRPAEFITTRWSIEGDPITSIYRILPNGAVEVFIDSTQDTWSAKTWLHLACPGLSLIDGAPAQPAFGPRGPGGDCSETTL